MLKTRVQIIYLSFLLQCVHFKLNFMIKIPLKTYIYMIWCTCTWHAGFVCQFVFIAAFRAEQLRLPCCVLTSLNYCEKWESLQTQEKTPRVSQWPHLTSSVTSSVRIKGRHISLLEKGNSARLARLIVDLCDILRVTAPLMPECVVCIGLCVWFSF